LTSVQTPLFRADAVSDDTRHEAEFRRWSYQRSGAFDRERFEAALGALPAQLLRLKGHCRFTDSADPFTLQMVERRWTITPAIEAEALTDGDIVLVGVGTSDLPDTATLDIILDHARTADLHSALYRPSHVTSEGQRPCR
jgi:G3E family GTPase